MLNCHLRRDMESSLVRAGGGISGWNKITVEIIDPLSVLPYAVGTFTKKTSI
jgi:hypothetical protein